MSHATDWPALLPDVARCPVVRQAGCSRSATSLRSARSWPGRPREHRVVAQGDHGIPIYVVMVSWYVVSMIS